MDLLTKKQKETLAFIVNFVKEKDWAPTMREIAEGLGLSSPATVHEHIEHLKNLGYLVLSTAGRGVVPTKKAANFARSIELPLLGLITAGVPIEAVETRESVAVPADFVIDGINSYVLRVKGDSMIDDGIHDGDYVVVERNPSPPNGAIVVALLENTYATLKRFYREPKRIRLEPANKKYQPIFVHDLVIQGVVRAVMRRYV